MQSINVKCGCLGLALLGLLPSLASFDQLTRAENYQSQPVQKIRFVEDDAQNYLVSKIYEIKHHQANDLVPFILGAVKRYAKNGTVDRINYKAGKQQLIAVTCPVELMPYLDDLIAKLDRPSPKDQTGSGIEGTGISRNVYQPQYRSSARLAEIMVKTGISSNADEGANQDATVAFDAPSNLIYWKDSVNKDQDLTKYLAWLDRPVPQVRLSLQMYEVRESELLDLGLDYLAWKNGPGLNLFEAGARFLDGSALDSAFGPYGFFLFAPSFDLSFVRVLQQNGKATLNGSLQLTLTTGSGGELSFTPSYQNLTKNEAFASSVQTSDHDRLQLKVIKPVVSLVGDVDRDGRLDSSADALPAQSGSVNFSYLLTMKNVVERNQLGDELFEQSSTGGSVTVRTGVEQLLSHWTKEQEVEQTIGIPFLCELPVLKYIFGTTTSNTERRYCFLTVLTELVHPDSELAAVAGKLSSVPELLTSSAAERR